ncbi:chemotaxis protein [Actinomyces marmotae]|uniref:chemotaxis protein n=1 Tax=Actinomyces marmotae TaxID=2737173 RepID=UPI001358A783|nr:chemotaxis protein [Actinomyces marmotae]
MTEHTELTRTAGRSESAGDGAPPAPERVFEADEIFFSTTDAAGRIRRANSIFMRLSGYPRGALVGRAHNVVRHAVMPAGLFRGVWEDIEAGHAASAYITNRSSDGGHYRVFATIVPSGSGYLSIRTLPQLTEQRDAFERAFERVRKVEAASAAGGSTRRKVAAAGQAALRRELEALGYESTVDFTRQAVASEVAALVAAGVGIPSAEGAEGPVARVLAEMQAIEEATSGHLALLDELARLVRLLERRATDIQALSTRLAELRAALRATRDEVARLDASRPDAGGDASASVIGAGAGAAGFEERYRRVDALVLECAEELRPLAGQVSELRGDAYSVRFAIALMRLHNLASGFFAAQILAGDDDVAENDAVGSLEELTSALSEGITRLTDHRALLEARRELVGGELDAVAEELTATRGPLTELLAEAAAASVGESEEVRRAASLCEDGFPEARDLADLAGAIRDLEIPMLAAEIQERITAVRRALAELR